ncbi:hypothetical protein AXE80_03610 [Wenyingzhuangia fucanilytica]|uniref:DUF6250 domain-containing protein n=1 Tax=Wenyingzhuangia fucanilytica TaxID=1790137 RepID=A0A1B1Y3T0_9FLAO|nr:DUF6250 domain-containing protein [Wenyingzhuangia fucanilytica]ANW95420.1 hypothetical protein AXE80_03610 [Wenyingzhuangia fucanilytica]
MKVINIKVISLVAVLGMFSISCAQNHKTVTVNNQELKATLIFEENFDNNLDQWQVEQMPKGTVEVNKSKLEIDDVSGCTVWLKEKFSGSIMIEYDVFMIQDGGPNDRVSDLNCFWMATDPEHPNNLFANSEKRGGKFSNYDSLQLYYMGVGGNDNGTTRFRRYVGNGERPLLPEHDLRDAKYMLEPNKTYHIKIIAHNSIIQYFRGHQLLAELNDANPYTSGYFGFRTVKNHMTVDNFKVYKLK